VRLGRFRCSFLTYPRHPDDRNKRLKDLNEVLQHYGERGVVETIARRQWLRVDGVYRMSELPPPPEAPIYDIGFPRLRDHYRVRLGDLTIVTGIPSHGKSSFVNDLCCRLADTHGLGIAFASFEQQPTRDHRRNLRTWWLRRPVEYANEVAIIDADRWIDRHFSFLVPSEDDEVTVDWVLDRCEAAVVQYGARVIVIDPWNEMDHARSREESVTEYTGRAIKAFRRFARKFMVHLIVVAHPAKQSKNADGVYSIPTLYDISDSAHWYNKADIGIIVHKLGDGQSLIRVSKSRYHDEIGKPGEVEAAFEFPTRRYLIDE
jgi:twinkle protein